MNTSITFVLSRVTIKHHREKTETRASHTLFKEPGSDGVKHLQHLLQKVKPRPWRKLTNHTHSFVYGSNPMQMAEIVLPASFCVCVFEVTKPTDDSKHQKSINTRIKPFQQRRVKEQEHGERRAQCLRNHQHLCEGFKVKSQSVKVSFRSLSVWVTKVLPRAQGFPQVPTVMLSL